LALNHCSFGVNCNRTCLYFNLRDIGVVVAGELSAEYDYTNDYVTNDYVADDYPTAGSRPTDSEYLLGIAM
jgi:hypothetical protein